MTDKTLHAREAWLGHLAKAMHPAFVKAGLDPAKAHYRVSCSWPVKGGTRRKGRVRGECWHGAASGDGAREIFISPMEADTREVAAILAHELVHAMLPEGVKHGAPFVAAMKALGFVGPFTATSPNEATDAWLGPLVAKLGDYPHVALDPKASGVKKQGTRLLKAYCADCGYTVRVTGKWLNKGLPHCADLDHGPMRCDEHAGAEGED